MRHSRDKPISHHLDQVLRAGSVLVTLTVSSAAEAFKIPLGSISVVEMGGKTCYIESVEAKVEKGELGVDKVPRIGLYFGLKSSTRAVPSYPLVAVVQLAIIRLTTRTASATGGIPEFELFV
jgi:hypothetical protein